MVVEPESSQETCKGKKKNAIKMVTSICEGTVHFRLCRSGLEYSKHFMRVVHDDVQRGKDNHNHNKNQHQNHVHHNAIQ